MTITKLTKKLVPEFLFLTDAIVDTDGDPPDYKSMVVILEDHDYFISERSLQRAFELRRHLKGEDEDAPIVVSGKKTLDALVIYCFGGDLHTFKELLAYKGTKTSKEEIVAHYEENKPSEANLKKVFDVPRKLQLSQEHIEGLDLLLYELQNQSLENFFSGLLNERLKELQEKLGLKELKEELLGFIEERLAQQEKKQKRTSVIYRFLGSLGLLFVGVPIISDFKTYLLEDFLETVAADPEIEEGDEEYDTETLEDV